MDNLNILLLGSLIGLIIGILLLSQRQINLHVNSSCDEPRSNGCVSMILALLFIISLLAVLSNAPTH